MSETVVLRPIAAAFFFHREIPAPIIFLYFFFLVVVRLAVYSLGGLFVDISNLAVNNKKGIFSVVDGGGGGRTAAAVAPLAHFSARSSRAINYENDVCICIMTFSVVLYCSPPPSSCFVILSRTDRLWRFRFLLPNRLSRPMFLFRMNELTRKLPVGYFDLRPYLAK